MVEAIFTIDYEIYGNGSGSLSDLVFEPTAKLIDIFENAGARFVCFVEASEFEIIEKFGTDAAIKNVRDQIREMHERGFEIALHLHPQWYNAKWESGRWLLDDSEYNLCTQPRKRIEHIVGRAIDYLRDVVGDSSYTPVSFRAGNWLFQPTREAASVLAEHGVQIDSSVFKGGMQHKHRLDYRASLHNGPFWRFKDDVNVPDPAGPMLEIPIYSEMVPAWRMVTGKRVGLQKKGAAAGPGARQQFARLRDFLRLRQPLKFDFCRMTLEEQTGMTRRALARTARASGTFLPMVSIGHSKDLVDYKTVEGFLTFLNRHDVKVSTFKDVLPKCQPAVVAA